MKKRIILLTQWFEPEPTFKGLLFAKELQRQGFEVEVVTGFPNYPGGNIYPGYRVSWRKQEIVDGVHVTRLALYASHDSSAIRRVANYLSFAFTATLYCLFSANRADVIYVYQLPTLAAAACAVKAFRGNRVVFDIQDMWPDTLRATGMVNSEWVIRAVGRVGQWIYRHVDTIVVLSPGFRRLLIERSVPAEKIQLIYNWCDEASLGAAESANLGGFPGEEFFRIVFAGNMGKAQALDAVLAAAGLLRDSHPLIRFVFIGGGVEVERLTLRARELELPNVLFLPRVSMAKIGNFLRAADALLIHLKADPLFSITIPGKTQAYMAMGKPILIATPGDAAHLVREANCGVEAKPEDAKSIAEAAIRLAASSRDERLAMGKRARKYYETHLSLAVGVERFTQVFHALVHPELRSA